MSLLILLVLFSVDLVITDLPKISLTNNLINFIIPTNKGAPTVIQQPFGFKVSSTVGENGTIQSHKEYLTAFYKPGAQTRFIVSSPDGSPVTLSLDTTSPFRIRPYDFAVILDGTLASRVSQPCVARSYQTLGTRGTDYQSIVTVGTTKDRTLVCQSGVAVLDFCVHSYYSGQDPSMVGFQIVWSSKIGFPSLLSGTGTSSGATATPTTTLKTPTTTTKSPVTTTKSLTTTTNTPSTTTTTRPPTTTKPSPTIAAVQPGCGRPLTAPSTAAQETRIVGGVTAPPNSLPWASALILGSHQFCDCSLLDSQWAVTAGHCMIFDEAEMILRVKIYHSSQNLLTSKISSISRFIRHPRFSSNSDGTSNDFALIKLSTPIASFPNINSSAACLPSEAIGDFTPTTTAHGRPVSYVAGWGKTFQGQTTSGGVIGSGSDQLLQTTVELYNRTECVQIFGTSFPTTAICAGVDRGGKDSCQGDSGGPLVLSQRDGSYGLFGIVSFGIGCALPGLPGAYSDVFGMKAWILDTIAAS